MTGAVGENRDRSIAFIEAQGIEFAFTEAIAPALGMSYDGKFAMLSGAGAIARALLFKQFRSLGTVGSLSSG